MSHSHAHAANTADRLANCAFVHSAVLSKQQGTETVWGIDMKLMRSIRRNLILLSASMLAMGSYSALAQTAPTDQGSAVDHDGQHDFDFLLGTWHVHLKQLLNPLESSPKWVEINGTANTQKIWDGRANYDELELDGPTGHKESMTLRLYNPETRQWNLYWASSKGGVLGQPPTTGEFKNGRGEFFDGELFKGKAIFVHDQWSAITPNSCHFEQSFSNDGGKTWEANWIADYTRTGS
jgi:hypothetical protein